MVLMNARFEGGSTGHGFRQNCAVKKYFQRILQKQGMLARFMQSIERVRIEFATCITRLADSLCTRPKKG